MSNRVERSNTLSGELVSQKGHCENLLRRRFIVTPGFDIHGGCSGFFDFGPTGCAIKVKLEQKWREHFVVSDGLLEINTTCITPYSVFKASGHVDRFTDLMVQDVKTGDNYRADKLLEDWIENLINPVPTKKNKAPKQLSDSEKNDLAIIAAKADSYTSNEMDDLFAEMDIKSPEGNDLTKCEPFNLMFATKIGPKGSSDNSNTGYLRPETAQGMFVNFKRLYEQNYNKLPMGVAQVGLGFRNEIAPRNGLLRVREFQMAEIEYFVDPLNKSHSRFKDIKNMKLPLFPKDRQLENSGVIDHISIGDAVADGIIDNETLGYYLCRTYEFLKALGLKEDGIRFRQHLDTEMAHYAKDCWDAEILSSYGWIECAGHADRSAYDLKQHSEATGVDLSATRRIDPPRIEEYVEAEINAKLLGPSFRKDAGAVRTHLENMSDDDKMKTEEVLSKEGKIEILGKHTVTREMVRYFRTTRKINEESFTPHTIEPSFGIGRIFSMVMEHSFTSRGIEGQEDRNFLKLPPFLAPYQCSLLPLQQSDVFDPFIETLSSNLSKQFITCKVDSSGATVGKRYARTDEIGIPFGVTVDFQTAEDQTVTVRERDSMQQIRLPLVDVPSLIRDLCNYSTSWEDTVAKYGLFGA